MARLGRLELPTCRSGGDRSIHLSYRRAGRRNSTRKFLCPKTCAHCAHSARAAKEKSHIITRERWFSET